MWPKIPPKYLLNFSHRAKRVSEVEENKHGNMLLLLKTVTGRKVGKSLVPLRASQITCK